MIKINNLDGQKIKTINFSDGIEVIGDGALKDLGVINMNIPNSLTEIGNNALEGSGFEELTLSEQVKKIGDNSFKNCKNLKSVTIYNKTLTIENNAFEKKDDLVIYCYNNSTAHKYAQDNDIKFELLDYDEYEIDDEGALTVKTKKTKLEIPNTVEVKKYTEGKEEVENKKVLKIKKIENLDKQKIEEITFPKDVVEISDNALNGIGLVTTTFPEALKKFGDRACANCGFGKLTITEKIEEIGKECFKGTPLTEVYIYNKDLKIGEGAIEKRDDLIIYGHPGSTAKTYAKENGITFRTFDAFKWGEDNYNFGNWGDYFVTRSGDGWDNGYEIEDYYFNLLSPSLQATSNSLVARIGNWGGSCEGMALTTILFKNKLFTYNYWQNTGTANNEYELEDVRTNLKLKSLINIYMTLQHYIESTAGIQLNKTSYSWFTENFYRGVEDYYKNHEDEILLCCFGSNGWGHAIVITGAPEEGSYHEGRYKYRVPIYDNAYPNDRYIYFNSGFNEFITGNDSGLNWNYGSINYIYASEINLNTVMNFEKKVRENEKVSIDSTNIQYDVDAAVKVSNDNGVSAELEGIEKKEGDLECSLYPILGEENEKAKAEINTVSASLPKDDKYTIETINKTDKLNASMYFGDSFFEAKAPEGGKATFENKKTVKLENESGKEYEVSMTLNEEYAKTPWYTVRATGSGTKEVQIENTEEGTVIKGDNLKDLKVQGNNIEETLELIANTDKNKVLISANEDETKLLAKVDNDENGTFETVIAESEKRENESGNKDVDNNGGNNQENNQNNQQENNSKESVNGQEDNSQAKQALPKTGVSRIILIVIAGLIILAIIFKIKSKIN